MVSPASTRAVARLVVHDKQSVVHVCRQVSLAATLTMLVKFETLRLEIAVRRVWVTLF